MKLALIGYDVCGKVYVVARSFHDEPYVGDGEVLFGTFEIEEPDIDVSEERYNEMLLEVLLQKRQKLKYECNRKVKEIDDKIQKKY